MRQLRLSQATSGELSDLTALAPAEQVCGGWTAPGVLVVTATHGQSDTSRQPHLVKFKQVFPDHLWTKRLSVTVFA